MEMVKLILENWGELELTNDIVIPLTFDVNNIRDIQSRNGVYSKTVKIFGTNNNNTILNQAFDVNIQFQSFDIKKRENFRLIREGQTVMEGVFQLTKIHKKYENGNTIIIYDCYLKSDASNFFNAIDGKYLTDIYIGDLNHVMSQANVLESMKQGQAKDGYQYFLAYNDNTFSLYKPDELRPAIYLQKYFERIVNDAGYYYIPPVFNSNGDIINDPSFPEYFDLDFDKLIIPFNGDKLKPAVEDAVRFRVGIDGLPDSGRIGKDYEQVINYAQTGVITNPLFWAPANNGSATTIEFLNPHTFVIGDIILLYGVDSDMIKTATVIAIPTVTRITITVDYDDYEAFFQPNAEIQKAQLLLNNDYDIVYFNDNNPSQNWFQGQPTLYDTTTGNYNISQITRPTIFEATGSATIEWSLFDGFTPSQNIKLTYIEFGDEFTLEFKATIAVFDASDTFIGSLTQPQTIAQVTFNKEDSYDNNALYLLEVDKFEISGLYDPSFYFNNGVTLKVLIFTEIIGGVTPIFALENDSSINERNTLRVSIGMIPGGNEKNYFTNISEVDIVDGVIIDMASAIPKNVKQSDFVAGLARMFNLYIKEDKLDPKKLIIKTRDRWYADGQTLDWTDKLDITSVDIEPISNKLQKIKKFNYKPDSKDTILQAYTEQTGEIFGEQSYIFGNDFIKGESKVEPIFSPTVQVYNIGESFAMNQPYIQKKSPKNNIRILYVGDVLQNYWIYDNNGDVSGIELPVGNSTYRHVGHLFPNSFTPIKDLNYGLSQFYAHNFNFLTNNNLYNRFYFKQFDIFENGYMMTAKFKLDYLDVLELGMDETIYVYDHYWTINRILDFDPSKNGLTEVELISANGKLGTFTANNTIQIDRSTALQSEINNKSLTDNKGNKYQSGVNNTKVIGNYNTLQAGANTNLIVGNNNTVDGDNNFLIGNKTSVTGNNITGINASGISLDQGDVVNIGRMVEVIHIIDASEDIILDYPDGSVINVIDSGSDDVLPLGTFKIQNVIDSGENRVL
jgi:hypothetical protein